MSGCAIVALVMGGAGFALLVVGYFIGPIVPEILTGINQGRQERTADGMKTIAFAVEAYAADHGVYPSAESVEQLADALEPQYVADLPQLDGWADPFVYLCWQVDPDSRGCDSYVIGSPGRDRVFEVADLRSRCDHEVLTAEFDSDIVLCTGKFVQRPEGL